MCLRYKGEHLFLANWLDPNIYNLTLSYTNPSCVLNRIYGSIYTYEDELLTVGNGIYIYDITDPEEPDLDSWYSGDYHDAVINGDYVYAMSYAPGTNVNAITTLKRD